MAYRDLRDFIRALEKNDELKRIPFEVDPILEITEFADRAVKTGRPALLFEKPKGYNVPVLINAFASMRRWRSRSKWNRWTRWRSASPNSCEMRMPEGHHRQAEDAAEAGGDGRVLSEDRVEGRRARKSSSTDGFSLLRLSRCCNAGREDGGRFITLPMVFSRNPDTGKRNCGMYRMQVYDERTTGMHWQTHKQGAEHYRRMQQQGKQAHGRRGGDRRRPGDDVLGDSAAAARSRRDDDRRLPARQARSRW